MKLRTKNKIIENWRFLLGIYKSIYLNFRYLKFKDAVKLPILVSYKTKLKNLRGKITVENPKFGMIKIGLGNSQAIDYKYYRAVIDNQGEIIFKGKCMMGSGTRLSVQGILILGDRANFGGNTTLICHKKISIGDNTLIGWDSLLCDTDQHPLINISGDIINPDKEIFIGSNVWVGSRSVVMKGSYIGDDIVIAAQSNITGKHNNPYTVLAGNPLRVVRENIKRG